MLEGAVAIRGLGDLPVDQLPERESVVVQPTVEPVNRAGRQSRRDQRALIEAHLEEPASPGSTFPWGRRRRPRFLLRAADRHPTRERVVRVQLGHQGIRFVVRSRDHRLVGAERRSVFRLHIVNGPISHPGRGGVLRRERREFPGSSPHPIRVPLQLLVHRGRRCPRAGEPGILQRAQNLPPISKVGPRGDVQPRGRAVLYLRAQPHEVFLAPLGRHRGAWRLALSLLSPTPTAPAARAPLPHSTGGWVNEQPKSYNQSREISIFWPEFWSPREFLLKPSRD